MNPQFLAHSTQKDPYEKLCARIIVSIASSWEISSDFVINRKNERPKFFYGLIHIEGFPFQLCNVLVCALIPIEDLLSTNLNI